MAPSQEYGVAAVHSTQVLSHDEGSILVDAGGFTPMRWFLEHGLGIDANDDADDEPPKKRRKTETPKPVKAKVVSDAEHILVSRISLDLHFPETLGGKPAKEKAIQQDVEFDRSESIVVVPSIVNLFEDGTRLRLALSRMKSAVIMVDTAGVPQPTLDALQNNVVSRLKAKGGPHEVLKQDSHPASWTRCTLTRSRGQLYTVVRLETSLYWRTGVSAFPAGVPIGKARVYPDYSILAQAFPDAARDERDASQDWTPQDFYDSVHVPDKAMDTKGDFDGLLESDLYPFQKRAVHWMLKREGVEHKEGQLHLLPRSERRSAVKFYEAFADLTGKKCYVDHLQGIVQREEPHQPIELSGGLLAEEMGLGKTVELMALLSLHKRQEPMPSKAFDPDSGIEISPSKATLIITPASILQQWRSELSRHAPALRVLYYEGVSSKKTAKAEQQLISDMTSKYDVVLTTYQTLAREVHFTEDPPERNMRHAPKFERKRSPLVRIEWWRICLDEAQMVESGVTAAARVARRLTRIHSWAVSGTPLRKNVQDLHGLLIFLRYKPLCDDGKLWSHLITNHKHLFRRIFGEIALRHTKAQIREDLHLPAQKRVVINMPFSAIEQQHYSTLFSQMCEAVGVNSIGAPNYEDWDPEDPGTVEAMRSFLTRLRQTCLHPQVGGKNRKALGRGTGPLRTVAEVLEVMIDQNETNVRTEERALLASQLIHAHILGNARDDDHRSEKALQIYSAAMRKSSELVKEARERLESTKQAQVKEGEAVSETDDEDSSSESTPVLGRLRNNLRTAIQLQHACTFFAATAYFQIKSNETLTTPDSDRFKELEEKETGLYETAKLLRKEILKDASRKSESLMRKIEDMQRKGTLTKTPAIKELASLGGIESRRIVDKSDDVFDVIREQASVIVQWREKMSDYLLKPLVDKDEGIETTGDEYEDSTKLQDELYAYFDAVKAMQADLNTFVTGEDAPLIDHEVKYQIREAKKYLDPEVPEELKTQVHAPELTLELLAIRNKFRAKKEKIGCLRGLIQETRGLETSLQGHESGARAAERTFVRQHLHALQSVFSAYTKVLNGLEKEVDLFRQTQNQRLEFYRQLQELSDAVQPHKDELDETLDLVSLQTVTQREEEQTRSLAQLKTKNRFLLHLRDESGAQDGPKICVICQCPFENGVLTVCGHQYCKECIQHWWSEHKTCPVCKRRLATVDFHNITYKPQELRAQEEVQSGSSSPSEATPSPSRQTSIYSDVDNQLMQEIKSIDLPTSYGTKIDTLGRHLHWIRDHDPGAKSIVFSQFREFLDVLGTALQDFKIGYSRLGRAGAVEKFKNDPSVDCLLLDAKTDSSGLTLVNATHVFICEPLIQTAVELQAIARVHRIGQTRPTTVWMYLINDTVEEAIYDTSVTRRLEHVQSRQSIRTQKSRSATPAPLQEIAIDVANSEEMQSAPISKLLVAGKGGGELVSNDDLWRCLFGKVHKAAVKPSIEMETEVNRHLRAEAAEGRRLAEKIQS